MKKFNVTLIIKLVGVITLFNSKFILVSALVSYFYEDGATFGLMSSWLLLLIIGSVLMILTRKSKKEIKKNEGYLVVSIGWIIMALSGALPYILTGTISHFADAFFESMSGYTTTGASIINDIEALPQGILLWRSITHWIGGMGIIVLAIAILPLLGIGGMQLFMAEAPGPNADKLHPRITDTAKRLWLIYAGFTLIQSIALKLGGMSFFDAINHAMATVSCGGFSTKNSSLAYWNSTPVIGYLVTIFMFASGTNFVLIYYAVQRKFKKILEDDEFKFYAIFVLIASTIVTISIYFNANIETTDYNPMVWGRVESSIRHSFFQVISIVTSTGFVTSDYGSWTPLMSVFFFGLFFAGACSGSTGGGIKMVRHFMLIKNGFLEFKRTLHTNAIILVRLNKKIVSRNGIYNILAFFIFYLISFIIGAIIFGFLGLELTSALSLSASCLGNIGPALGDFGPLDNYSALSDSGKFWASFLMMIGRLEILTVLILFSPYYWRKN